MPRFFRDDNGVDWVHAEDAKEMENKYADKPYKIIKVPFNLNTIMDDSSVTMDALDDLEYRVNDYMEHAEEDYTTVGMPTILGHSIIQVLIDEEYSG